MSPNDAPDLPSLTSDPRREKEEKKRGGLWAWWRSLVEGEGAVGAAGAEGGAASIGAGAAAGAAGLGAKAGLVALLAAMISVASVGLAAWDAGGLRNRGFHSIFAPHPNAGGAADAAAGAAGNGPNSLDYFKQANGGKGEEGQAADAGAAGAANGADAAGKAGKDGAGKDVAKDAAAMAAAAAAAAHKGIDRGDLSAKKGSLPAMQLRGGGGASSGASFGTGAATTGGAGAKGGGTGALASFSSSGGKVAHAGAMSRARKFGAAGQQAQQSFKDGHGATSSQAAGQTFDGAGAGGGAIGASGAVPLGGAGSGGRDVSQDGVPSSSPGSGAEGGNRFSVPDASDTHQNVTPWQKAVEAAGILVGVALGLIYAASILSKMVPYGKFAAWALCIAACALGAEVLHLGGEIAGGKYGQQLQGDMFIVGGGAVMCTAIAAMGTGFSLNGATVLAGMIALGATAVGYLNPGNMLNVTSYCGAGEKPDVDKCTQGPDPDHVPDCGIFSCSNTGGGDSSGGASFVDQASRTSYLRRRRESRGDRLHSCAEGENPAETGCIPRNCPNPGQCEPQ